MRLIKTNTLLGVLGLASFAMFSCNGPKGSSEEAIAVSDAFDGFDDKVAQIVSEIKPVSILRTLSI